MFPNATIRPMLAIFGWALAISAAVVGWACFSLFGADTVGLPVWAGAVSATAVPILVLSTLVARRKA